VFTRDQLSRTLRSRWLFAWLALALVIGALVLTQRDRPALAAASDGATDAVSVADSGGFGNLDSDQPAISATGRFVAFRTLSPLDPLDLSNDSSNNVDYDIYVRDTVARTTTYISRGFQFSDGGELPLPAPSNGDSFTPSISADGRYIAFSTNATNITPMPEATHTVVICDRGPVQGNGTYGRTCNYTTLRVGEDGTDQTMPRLSGNAHRVALLASDVAEVVNLTLDPTGAIAPISDADVGQPAVPETIVCAGNTESLIEDVQIALSADGRYLVRTSVYEEEEEGCNFTYAVWVNDLNADAAAVRLDLDSAGHFIGSAGNTLIGAIAVSGNGRRVAFVVSNEQVAPEVEIPFVVHAVDRDPDGDGTFGPTTTADIVSRDVSGGVVGGDDPSFSTDGRYFAFITDAPRVHNGFDVTDQDDTCIHPQPVITAHSRPLEPAGGRPAGGQPKAGRLALAAETGFSHCDVVVHDLVVDARRAAAGQSPLPAELASPSLFSTCAVPPPDVPCEGDADSFTPVLDADGSAVAFGSAAHDLVENDENQHTDVFLRRFLPTVTVSPVDFGQVELGAAGNTVSNLAYLGFGPLTLGPATIGGTNAGDFDVFPSQACAITMHDGDAPCMVPVRFQPAQLGTRTGTLTVTSSDGRAFSGTLTGVGVPAPPPKTPGFAAAPDPLAFGTRPLFLGSPAQTVTVTNSGTAPLSVLSVTLVGTAPASFPGDYAITANTCLAAPVDPGATCQVSVVFAPQAVGERPALLQFTDNVVPGPQMVGLTGAGAAPTLAALPPLNPPGAVSRVVGAGFPPGKVVVLTLDGMPGQTSATPDGTGAFTAPLVIFPHTAPGKRQLHATVQGVPTPITVSIDYLVVPGSLQPPDFAERR
jgi:Tol biopolymer transport system component